MLSKRLVTVSDFSSRRTQNNPPTKITVNETDTTATMTIIMTTINQQPGVKD